ncbi:MAG: LysR family transcriptional regulator [Lachnospiraceae bacterium]|jgi:DNA-binding transcriptional LysR family regulator|nr:LysR family transcriptional regulator [Lachnospiraceae bacterium]
MFENKEYIFEIYKTRSFSKAAENLYISQPSLSLTVKRIERSLGTQLFDRSSNPIAMTDSGLEYIKCAQKLMDIENEYGNYINELENLQRGTLTIGASNFFTSYILPKFIAIFLSEYPGIELNVIEADANTLEKKLFSGELDMIVENMEMDDKIYKKLKFYRERLLLAVPKKFLCNEGISAKALSAMDIKKNIHKDKTMSTIDFNELGDTPFLLLRFGNNTRELSDKIFKEQGFKPNAILELDQLATAYYLASHELGATLVSDTIVKETLPDDRLVYYKLDSKLATRQNYFFYKQGKYVSKAMEKFLEIALKK